MKTMIILVILAALAGFSAWVRLAPVNAARWHVDPLSVKSPLATGWLVRPEGGDAAWATFDADETTLLQAFDDIAMAEPRTQRLEGNVASGRITYVTRSKIWGFPDFTTVQAVPVAGGTSLAVLARLRFGRSDFGVNRARVERWYDALGQRLAQVE